MTSGVFRTKCEEVDVLQSGKPHVVSLVNYFDIQNHLHQVQVHNHT